MVGSDESKKMTALLQESLDSLKKNVEIVGSIEELKAKYPKGYKKLIAVINKDLVNLRNSIYTGVRIDDGILDEEILKQMWGDRSKEITKNVKRTFSADAIARIYTDYVLELVKAFPGLIFNSELEQLNYDTLQKCVNA